MTKFKEAVLTYFDNPAVDFGWRLLWCEWYDRDTPESLKGTGAYHMSCTVSGQSRSWDARERDVTAACEVLGLVLANGFNGVKREQSC